jgi:nucleoside-diphosphate-sugar epimerase
MATLGGRALVTGATGFLGAALTARLRGLGLAVTALGRDGARGAHLVGLGARFVSCELDDASAVWAAVAGHDYVFHCAALSSPWGRYREFHRSNVVATETIAAASRAAGVRRFIHVSTPSIYADQRDRLGVREDAPLPARAVNHYAATKRLAERVVDEAYQRGLPVITIRPQGIFGPGDRAIFPRLIRVASRGRLPVFGDGRNLVDVTYVDNVVDSLLACATAPATSLGKKYNISNGEPVRGYEFLERMLEAVGVRARRVRVPFSVAYGAAAGLELVHRLALAGREPPLTRYSVIVLGKSRTLDISAARAELMYHPRVGLDEGIARFARWWKEQDRVAG